MSSMLAASHTTPGNARRTLTRGCTRLSQPAAVSYSLDRRGGTLASGQLTLEEDGSFTVRFATKDDDYYGGFLNLTVKVVDSTGETKEFSGFGRQGCRLVRGRGHHEKQDDLTC